MASGSLCSSIALWNASDGKIALQWAAEVCSLAFSPNSRYLLSGCEDGEAVIWDLSRGAREVVTLEGHSSRVLSCAWSPDGSAIATGSDGIVRIWDAVTFQHLHVLNQGSMAVRSLTFSPHGCWLASSAYFSCSYCIWDVVSGTLCKFIHIPLPKSDFTHTGAAVAFHPESMRLATIAENSGSIELWDVETGRRLGRIWRDEGKIYDLSFSPNGRLLLGAMGQTVMIWDTLTKAEGHSLEGHQSAVLKACFSPCGKYIASASWDGTVRLWRTTDGSCVAICWEHGHAVVAHLAFSPDGKTLSSGASDGTVVIRHIHDIVSLDEQNP